MLRKFILLFLLMFMFNSSAIAELTGDQIVARVDEIMQSDNFKTTTELRVIRPNKTDRVFKLRIYGKGDKVLVRFLLPLQEKGKGYLRLGEESWFYLPSTNKSIRINGKQSVQGSDLYIDDIMRIKLANDYSAKIIDNQAFEGVNYFILELTAKKPSVTYGKIKYWIKQDNYIPLRFECYTVSGILIKTVTYSNVRQIGEKIRPTSMEIVNSLQKNYKTILNILEADFNANNPDNIFTKVNFEKIE